MHSIRKYAVSLLKLDMGIRTCTIILLIFYFHSSCPGLLNYNITCVAVQELMSGPLDDYQLKKDAGDEDGGEGGGGAESESELVWMHQ